MELRSFQNEALNRILERYDSKGDSALVIMPAGTGKTVLAVHLSRIFLEEYNLSSIGYIAPVKVMQSAFDSMIKEKSSNPNVKSYLAKELVTMISKKEIKKDYFDILIFDDFGESEHSDYKLIFDYFNGFKVGFTRDQSSRQNAIFFNPDAEYVYKYSFNQAIADGYFFESQKALNHFFNNLRHQIKNIAIGTDWSNTLSNSLIQNIETIRDENNEYHKAQEILLSGKIKLAEILELSHKKEQLNEFNKLLNDEKYFDSLAKKHYAVESVWQNYFESNPWIFGFGLNFVFNSPLDGEKLEQTIEGYSIAGHGKRTDALLKTTGLIQTLCFGEIKTHRKQILKATKNPYRSESWAISGELAGGIAQIHRTIQKSLTNITNALSIKDRDGFTENHIYLYKPKSFLIIGSLREFMNEKDQINEDKFSSFELFRRSIADIEIITFDELYERANAIINKKWIKAGPNKKNAI